MLGRVRTRTAIAAGIAGTLAAAALTLLPSTASSADEEAKTKDSTVDADLAQVRRATAKYQDVKVAIADGYQPPQPYECVTSPAGTMGYHYGNVDLIDDQLDILKPEAVLYIPGEDGRLKLVAVEYLVPDADQDPDTDDDRPTLFNRTFDGPHEGAGLPVHYSLHAWIWTENPNGTFAEWNPAISC